MKYGTFRYDTAEVEDGLKYAQYSAVGQECKTSFGLLRDVS